MTPHGIFQEHDNPGLYGWLEDPETTIDEDGNVTTELKANLIETEKHTLRYGGGVDLEARPASGHLTIALVAFMVIIMPVFSRVSESAGHQGVFLALAVTVGIGALSILFLPNEPNAELAAKEGSSAPSDTLLTFVGVSILAIGLLFRSDCSLRERCTGSHPFENAFPDFSCPIHQRLRGFRGSSYSGWDRCRIDGDIPDIGETSPKMIDQ